MNNFIETIYFASPVVLQNLLISFYGKKLYGKRYGNNLASFLDEIEKIKTLSPEETEKIRIEKLKKILHYANTEIEYYKELFNQINFLPSSVKSLKDLQKIPPLEKETLRIFPGKFVPRDIKKKSYMVQKTSGSTGTPLAILVDKHTYQLAMALLVDHEKQHGINFGDRKATFAGRMVQKIQNLRPPFWRFNSAENQMLFSSYHLNNDTFPLYLAELNKFRPKEIIGYPSAIYSFSCFVMEKQERICFVPKAIVTNSETLFDWQRKVIEDVFGCRVADYYGTSEYIVFAGQCEKLNYHINPLLGEVEVVNESGQQIFGESGDILCTSFSNYAMPLIRYRIGDIGVVSQASCDCGCNMQTLVKIEGRIDDVVLTIDGRQIGRIDHIFKGVKGVKECQIVQNDYNDFTLNVVKGIDFEDNDIVFIKNNLKERVGQEITISVKYLPLIPRTERGKFKGVIRKI